MSKGVFGRAVHQAVLVRKGMMMANKKKVQRRRRCENCNELKHDVERTVDPYLEDVKGIEVLKNLCTDCRNQLAADI